MKENIAREIKPLLRLLVPTVCHGCVFDCPGQLDHDVCMDPETIGAFGKLFPESWERLKIKTLVQDGDLVRDVMMENMVEEEGDIFDKVLEVATHNLSDREGGYTHKELRKEFRLVYKDMVLQKRLLNKSQEHKRIMKTVEELRERHEDFSFEEALDEAVRLRRRMLDDMVPEPDDLEAVEDLDDVGRM